MFSVSLALSRTCDLYIDLDGIGVPTTWNSGVGERHGLGDRRREGGHG